MLKIIILSQMGADRYQKLIFQKILSSPPWRAVTYRSVTLKYTPLNECYFWHFDTLNKFLTF